MSQLSISIPDSIHRRIEHLAKVEGVSLDAYVAAVLSQRAAVADADTYIRERAKRGSAEQMLGILLAAPKVEPESSDRMESPDA